MLQSISWVSVDCGTNKSTGETRVSIPVWEQLATDHFDPWQVVPRQVFTPYDCLLSSVAFVALCCVGCLWVTGMGIRTPLKSLSDVSLFLTFRAGSPQTELLCKRSPGRTEQIRKPDFNGV